MSGAGAYGALGDPFQDPSVRDADTSSLIANEFNPFAAPAYPSSGAASGSGSNTNTAGGFGSIHEPVDAYAPSTKTVTDAGRGAYQAAPSNSAYGALSDVPVAYEASRSAASIGASGNGSGGTGYFAGLSQQEREKELLRREQHAAAREKELDLREYKVQQIDYNPPNWPSTCNPILYHDIDAEIPLEYRPLVKKMYSLCLFTWLCLVWNWFCVLALWNALPDNTSFGEVLWASIWVMMGGYGAWAFWYRNLYFSLRDSTTFTHLRHLFWFFGHFLFCATMELGMSGTASGGMLSMIVCFSKGAPKTGIMVLSSTAMWGFNLLVTLYAGRQTWQTWKSCGAEARAEKEAAQAANNAVAAGVQAHVQAQVNQQFQPAQQQQQQQRVY